MKKPKFSFGEQGFKGFLAAHVEKIVLGFVMLLVLYFLYSGYSLEGYNAIRTPRQLKSQTEETRQFVLTDTALNRINGDEKRAIIRDHKERAEKSRNATSGADYPVGTINQPNFANKNRRGDVKLLAAESVEVRSFLVAMLQNNEDAEEDPYAKDGTPSPRPSTKKTDTKKGESGPAGGIPGGLPGAGGPAGGPGGLAGGDGAGILGGDPSKEKNKKDRKKGGNPFDGLGNQKGKDGSGLGGGMGGNPAASGPRPSKSYMDRYVDWSPGKQMMGGRMPGQQAESFGKTQYIVSIMALVPYEKQVEEYQRVFTDSSDYEPTRDSGPRYSDVIVERAEVPSDPNEPLNWTRIKRNRYRNLVSTWPQKMPEIADPRYVDQYISLPLPPAMLIDPVKFGLHSQIPQANSVVDVAEPQSRPKKRSSESDDDENTPWADDTGGPGGMGGGGFGGGGALGGGGMGGVSGPGGGMGGMGGMGDF